MRARNGDILLIEVTVCRFEFGRITVLISNSPGGASKVLFAQPLARPEVSRVVLVRKLLCYVTGVATEGKIRAHGGARRVGAASVPVPFRVKQRR
jgi:hypothetical protein